MKNLYKIILILSTIFLTNTSFSQDGVIDTTFNYDGWVSTVIGPKSSSSNDVALQSDGKIIVVGPANNGSQADYAAVRYMPNGLIDSSFAVNGISWLPVGLTFDIAVSVEIMKNDQILIGGYAINSATNKNNFAIVRLRTDGLIDSTFGTNGRVFTSIRGEQNYLNSIKLQNDGKIVAVGYPQDNAFTVDAIIVRYLENGELDTGFGNEGIVLNDFNGGSDSFNDIAFQKDGKLLAVGYTNNMVSFRMEMFLARYNYDGTLDSSFGNEGMVTHQSSYAAIGYSVGVQADGKILVAAEDSKKFEIALFRYNIDGTLDESFGTGGLVSTKVGTSLQDTPNTLLLMENGQFIVTASSYINNAFAATAIRYNNDGSIDESFGDSGFSIATTDEFMFMGFASTLQPDGKIIITGRGNIAGKNRFALVRINNSGTPLTDINKIETQIPNQIQLSQNYPNPFNPTTNIKFTLPTSGMVTLKIYDLLGKEVTELINDVKSAGTYELSFDASNLASGMYIYKLQSENTSLAKKMLLLR